MNRTIFFRQGIRVFVLLFVLGVAVASCKKDELSNDQPPVAGLMAYNLAPDQSSVDFRLSGNPLPTGGLAYPAYSGTYLNIYAGSRTVEALGLSQTLDTLTYIFEPNKYYSAFVVGANNDYRVVISHDNYDSLTASSGKAYVRYINALPNAASSTVSIAVGGSNVINANAPFGQVSDFTAVDPGDVSVSVSNEAVVGVNRTITLGARKAYTVLLAGLPNQSDSAKAVQIRYLENGTVTD